MRYQSCGPMQPNLKIIYVAAGVLEQDDGCVFLVQRPRHKEMGGLWEIPGGKIENGEIPEKTLKKNQSSPNCQTTNLGFLRINILIHIEFIDLTSMMTYFYKII